MASANRTLPPVETVILKIRPRLDAAMMKAGADPAAIRLAPGMSQEDYSDLSGLRVDGDDVIAKRAAEWIATYLRLRGYVGTRYSVVGRPSAQPIYAYPCRAGDRRYYLVCFSSTSIGD